MKIFKRLLACLSANLLMTNCISLVSTRALETELEISNALSTVYTSADVNRNGTVSITDSVILNQYLTGFK